MRNIILLLLILALALCACSSTGQGTEPQGSGNTETSANQGEDELLVLQNPENGNPYININRFHEILETVELTAENWMDYIEVCSYIFEEIKKDGFGEIVSTEKFTRYELGAKGDRYYNFRDFAIELKSKTTGKLITLTASNDSYRPSVEEDFRLDDYECTRIKGTLYLVDLPVEAIITKPDTATQLFIVGYSDINEGTAYNCYLAGTNSRSIGGMFDFLVYG